MNKSFDVLVALSGGLDSCVAARTLQHDGNRCAAFFVNLQKPSSEAEQSSATAFARIWNIPLEVVNFTTSRSIPTTRITDSFLGLLTLCCLGSCLARSIGATSIALGLTRSEVESVGITKWSTAQQLLSSTFEQNLILFPLSHLTKAEIRERAGSLGVSIESTWSCLRSSEVQCGCCEGCCQD